MYDGVYQLRYCCKPRGEMREDLHGVSPLGRKEMRWVWRLSTTSSVYEEESSMELEMIFFPSFSLFFSCRYLSYLHIRSPPLVLQHSLHLHLPVKSRNLFLKKNRKRTLLGRLVITIELSFRRFLVRAETRVVRREKQVKKVTSTKIRERMRSPSQMNRG